MKITLKELFTRFLIDYIHVDLKINNDFNGLKTDSSINSSTGKFNLSKKSLCITHWFNTHDGGEAVKEFKEYRIVRKNGNILINTGSEGINEQTVMKMLCKNEPLVVTN